MHDSCHVIRKLKNHIIIMFHQSDSMKFSIEIGSFVGHL